MKNNKSFRNIFAALFLCVATAVFVYAPVDAARTAELFIWQNSESSARLVLMRTGKQTYEEAARKYLKAYNEKKDLRKIAEGPLKIKIDSESFHSLSSESATNKPRFIVIAADPYQASGAVTAKNWYRGLDTAGADVFVMPTAADIGLSKSDSKTYQDLIAENFAGMLLLGGNDIDPSLYGEKNTDSEDLAPTRDESEYEMLKAYMKAEKGSVFGICRGQQLIAVASGYKLIQDIRNDQPDVTIRHQSQEHLVRLLPVAGSPLTHAFEDKEYLTVVSIHHQAVDIDSNKSGPLKVLARSVVSRKSDANPAKDSEAQIVEAIALKNGRGFAVQFHPEMVYKTLLGRKIFSEMVRVARLKSKVRKSCLAELK